MRCFPSVVCALVVSLAFACVVVASSTSEPAAEKLGRLQHRVLAEVAAAVEADVSAEHLAQQELLSHAYAQTEEHLVQAALNLPVLQTFSAFVSHFNKIYPTAELHAAAQSNFETNLQRIAELNAADSTAKFAPGIFADLSHEEFLLKYTGAKPTAPRAAGHALLETEAEMQAEELEAAETEVAAAMGEQNGDSDFEVNYDEVAMLESEAEVTSLSAYNLLSKCTPIKNQGQCGSCAHHAAVEGYETLLAVKGYGLNVFSQQQLLDCSNGSCGGSDTFGHWQFLNSNGGVLYKNYPYTARKGSCRIKSGPGHKLTPPQYVGTAGKPCSETTMYNRLRAGYPIVIYVDANEAWQHYKSGIMSPSSCGQHPGHAVTIVGYGQSGSTPYWLVRNHWGAGWGEKGYIRLAFGHNTCGVSNWAMFPTVAARPCTFTPPTNGGAGNCPSSLAPGKSCSVSCKSGYFPSGTTSCSTSGAFSRQTCVVGKPCSVGTPAHGSLGSCKSSLATGASCQIACATGYTRNGASTTCSNGSLHAQTCTPSPCTVTIPSGAEAGTCPTTLASGQSCSIQCTAFLSSATPSETTCNLGQLTAQTCHGGL